MKVVIDVIILLMVAYDKISWGGIDNFDDNNDCDCAGLMQNQ